MKLIALHESSQVDGLLDRPYAALLLACEHGNIPIPVDGILYNDRKAALETARRGRWIDWLRFVSRYLSLGFRPAFYDCFLPDKVLDR